MGRWITCAHNLAKSRSLLEISHFLFVENLFFVDKLSTILFCEIVFW